MENREFVDSREGFSAEEELSYEECDALLSEHDDDYEDDGQPSEYDEWQDLYGGDDWDHGQYDCYDEY